MKKDIKILILEDLPTDAELVIRELKKAKLKFTFRHVDSKIAFLKELNEFLPDIVLSDYSMPQFTGIDALEITTEQYPHIPLIIVTGSINEETAVECMKKGAADYVLKENLIRLGSSVIGVLEKKELLRQGAETKAELLKSEENFRNLYENVTIGLYRCTPEGKILIANSALVKMLGYSSFDELKTIDLEDELLMGYKRSEFKDTLERENKITGWESWWRRRDGSKIDVSESATIVYDDNGKPLFYDGTVEDITDRKKAEEETKVKSLFLESLIMQSPLPTFVMDSKGFILIVNKAFLKFYAVPNEELVLGANALTEPANIQQGVVPYFEEALKGKIVEIPEIEFDSPYEGKKVIMKGSLFPIFDPTGALINVVSIQEDITERKRAEEKLRESENRYFNLFNNANDLIQIANSAGKLLSVNKKWLDILEYSQEEAKKLWVTDIIRNDQIPQISGLLQKVIEGETISIETIFITKSGKEIYVEGTGDGTFRDGKFISAAGIFRDITERKLAEDSLRESERKYREVVENASEVIMITDINGNFQFMNKAGNLITGYSEEEFINYHYLDLIDSDYKRRVQVHYIRQFLKKEPSSHIEYPYISKSGEKRWFAQSASLIFENDQVVGFHLIARDVTERKQAETELHVQRAYLEELIEGAPEAIAILDNEDRIQRINREFTNIFEYKVEETIGRKINDLIVPEHLKTEGHKATHDVSEGKSVQLETIRCNKSGKLIHVSILGNPIKLKGDQLAVYGIYRDITERKQAEEALKASEERYRILVDNAFDGIYLLRGRCYEYANPRFCEITGYSLEEVTAPDFDYNVILTEDTKQFFEKRYFARVNGQEIPNQYEVKIIRKNGEFIDLEVSTVSLGGKGKPMVLGIMRDITKRKRTEEALRKSEERFNQVAAASREIIWEVNPEGLYTHISAIVEEVLGYEVEEIVGKKHFFDLHPSEGRETFKTTAFDAFGKKQPFTNLENHAQTKDGRIVVLSTNGLPILDHDGKLLGYRGSDNDITDRKLAEEERSKAFKDLRVSQTASLSLAEDLTKEIEERKLAEEAIKAGNIGLWDWGFNSNTVNFSTEWKSQIGYQDHELAGNFETWKSLIHPDDIEQTLKNLNKALKAPYPQYHVEFRMRHKDGTYRWILAWGIVQFDESEQPEGMIGTHIDITERKQAEAELKKSSEIINRSPVVAFLWQNAENWPVEYASEGVRNLFGYNAKDFMTGKISYAETIHPDDLKRVFEEVTNCSIDLKKKEFVHDPYRIITKDGEVKWIDDRTNIIRDKNGEITHYQGIILDVTDHKKAEEDLRRSEETLSGIIQSIPDYMSIIDEDYNIVWANEVVMDSFGVDVTEKKCYEVYHRIDKPCKHCIIQEVFADGKVHSHEAKTVDKDGDTIYQLSLASVASRYPDGRPKTAIEISRDITEQKSLEDQFRQAQKMESVGRLAGGVAHDFNNLLTVISGYADLSLRSLNKRDPLYDKITTIQDSALSAADLTRQLLAFSRKQTLEPKVLDLNQIISTLDKMLRRLIGEDIDFITIPAKELWQVNADPGQIEQVIVNLVVNARDAMSKGGKLTAETLNVTLDDEYARDHIEVIPGEYVMIEISDTGCGMSKEVMKQIYEPFFTTKEVGKGTGLGLSTVFGIVKQSGGYIYVYSEDGIGTTFKFYLPRVEAKADKIDRKPKIDEIPRGSETILVVEDQEAVREYTRYILEMQRYTVLEAIDGNDAYNICLKLDKQVDLVLTDVVMPNMSGKELVEKLHELWPDLKVVYMSGYTQNAIADQGVLKPGTSFIQKPFHPKEIAVKVRQALDGG
ncbi:MAG: PAS domain S-box protein [Candidatus Hatepunaea meridiana]|nr:PAS domain S-box protein [Candidatus Hatepunaea meridiana]